MPLFPPARARLLLPTLLAVVLLSACGDKKDAGATPPASAADKVANSPASATAAAPSAPAAAHGAVDLIAGVALYQSVCAACHADGTGNAPRLGHQADWAPRISQGEKALMQAVMEGKGLMPPKGTAMDADEEQLRAAVHYMLQNAR